MTDHLAPAGFRVEPARAIGRGVHSVDDHTVTHASHLPIVLVVCLVVEVLVAFLLFHRDAFWSPDSAIRFVQVESLLRDRYRDVAVPYPAASLDPSGQHFPIGSWFHFGREGRYYLSYLPYFSMASAVLYGVSGPLGLLLIPMASGLGAVWITYAVLRARAPKVAEVGALVLGLSTPLLIYSAVFWDHSLAVLLSTGALALMGIGFDQERPARLPVLIVAGGLLGLGFWVRNEMYLLALAAVLAWVFASRPSVRIRGILAMGSGLAVPAIGLWLLNSRLLGSPLGWKGHDLAVTRVGGAVHAVAGNALGAWIGEKLGNAYYLLASPDFYAFSRPAVISGLALAILLVASGVFFRIGVIRRSVSATTVGVIAGVVAGGLILSGRTAVSGLLPVAPFVVLAFLPGGASRWGRFLWATCVLYGAAVIATGTHGGLQWGPRYLLPILPPLGWLAAAGVARARSASHVWPVLRLGAATLLALSALIQVSGVDQVREAMTRNATINRWLEGISAEIVVTPLQWLTLGAGPVYFHKDLMLVSTPEDFKSLVRQFSERHVARWAYIPQSGTSFLPLRVTQWTAGRPWRFHPVDDHTFQGLRFVTFAGSAVAK